MATSATKKEATESVRELVDVVDQIEAKLDQTAARVEEKITKLQAQHKYLRNFPWIGLLALITVLMCGAGAFVVLWTVDNRTQAHWIPHITPNMAVTILNSVSTIALGIAISQGVAINWWRQALKGSTIKDLHRSWSFAASIVQLVLSGRYFNVIALASLMAKFAIIDGVLFQRALTTQAIWEPKAVPKEISGFARTQFPTTGYLDGTGEGVLSETPAWNALLNNWLQNPSQQSVSIFNMTGSDDYCYTSAVGPGFAWSCTSTTEDIDYGLQASKNFNGSDTSSWQNLPLFSVDFTPQLSTTNSTLIVDLMFTQASGGADEFGSCPAVLTRSRCELIPAMLNYTFTIFNETSDKHSPADSIVYLDTTKDLETGNFSYESLYNIIEPLTVKEDLEPRGKTMLGGFYVGLDTAYTSSVTLNYTGNGTEGGFTVKHSGSAGQQAVSGIPTGDYCNWTFSDPTSIVYEAISQWSFLMSFYNTSLGDDTYTSFVSPSRHSPKTVLYSVQWMYYVGGIVSMFVCVLCTIPSYYGYWQLSRKVSLGPFEIAHAFGAPMLVDQVAERREREYNGEVKILLQDVGMKKVQLTGGDGASRVVVVSDGNGNERQINVEGHEKVTGVVVMDGNGRERHVRS